MDVDFTESERADQAWAVKMWNKQTNGQATIELIYDFNTQSVQGLVEHDALGHNYVIRLESTMTGAADNPNRLGWMTSGGIYNPWKVPVSGAFVVDRMSSPEYEPSWQIAKKTYLHEFGHVLGLPHEPSAQAMMFPSVQPLTSACLKRADLDLFCHVNLCDGRTTYPCE